MRDRRLHEGRRGVLGRALERGYRWQSPFSLVSGALPLVVALGIVAALSLARFDGGAAGGEAGALGATGASGVSWLVFFGVLSVLPLAYGRHYPVWAGMLLVAVILVRATVLLAGEMLLPLPFIALLELPLLALYLGWFMPRRLGAPLLLVGLGVIMAVASSGRVSAGGGLHPFSAVSGATLVAVFCYGAAEAVRRSGRVQSLTDPLTRALNRRGFAEASERVRRRASRAGERLTLAVVDLDDFKGINDAGGHAAGDEVLRSAAAEWTALVGMRGISGRSGGLVGRLGGDEFVLLLRLPPEEAGERLRELRRRSDAAWSWGLEPLGPDDRLEAAIERADGQMYRWKNRR